MEREVQELLKRARGEASVERAVQGSVSGAVMPPQREEKKAVVQNVGSTVITQRAERTLSSKESLNTGRDKTISGGNGVDCVKNLIKPAEDVIKWGLDIEVENFSRRKKLWDEITRNYNLYLNGECGELPNDQDIKFRSMFEGALAILAWSFQKKGELFAPAEERFNEKEIMAIGKVLRYRVFKEHTKEELMNRLLKRDATLISLLKEYYNGFDREVDDVLHDFSVKLYLRIFLRDTWCLYKVKVMNLLAEAILNFDWLRDILSEN